jgi:hypothetical protein
MSLVRQLPMRKLRNIMEKDENSYLKDEADIYYVGRQGENYNFNVS